MILTMTDKKFVDDPESRLRKSLIEYIEGYEYDYCKVEKLLFIMNYLDSTYNAGKKL